MLTEKHGKVAWKVPTKPVEMRKACVAGGQPRKVGDVVELNQNDFNYLVNTGRAVPHLGEPVVTQRKKRKRSKSYTK